MANTRLLDLIKRGPAAERGPRGGERRRHRRWIPGLIVAAVFLTFGGVVWLAYQEGAGADGDVPLIRADARPFKASPDDPGGLEVPNQRLAVNVLLGSEPPLEIAEPAGFAPVVAEEARVPPPPAEETPPAEATAAPGEPEAAPPPPEAASPEPEAAPPAPPEPAPPPPPPARTQAPPAQATPAPTQAAPARAAPAPPPTVDAGTATTPRAFRIQLAAVNDEERARQALGNLWRTHADVLDGLQPRIERARIDGRLFFRIQAGPFEDRGAANTACDRLKERQAACIVVGG